MHRRAVVPSCLLAVVVCCVTSRSGHGEPQRRLRVAAGELSISAAGHRLVLLPRLRRQVVGRRPLEQVFRALRLTRGSADRWTVSAEHRDADNETKLSFDYREQRLEGRLDVVSLRDQSLAAETLLWSLSDARAQHIDRSYRWRDGRAPYFIDGFSPQVARVVAAAAELTLVGHGEGLWVRPRGRMLQLELESYHSANHPLTRFLACDDGPQSNAQRPTIQPSVRPLRRGERRSLHFAIYLGRLDPLLVRRYPAARRAALVFTDHADRASSERTEALLFGQTGALVAGRIGPRYPGLINRGLTITKAIFLRPSPGHARQFSDPRFVQLLETMRAKGAEIALHSPSGASDSTATTRAALIDAKHRGLTFESWIDHRPDKNCDALSNQGSRPGSRWYQLAVLGSHGLRYLWAVREISVGERLDLFRPQRGPWRPTVVYPVWPSKTAELRFEAFASEFFHHKRSRLFARLRPANVQRLIAAHGLLIAHTYLDSALAEEPSRTLLHRLPNGDYRLRADADALFAALAGRNRPQGLWSATIAQLIGQLRAVAAVRVDYQRDGVVLSSASELPNGLTLQLPRHFDSLRVEPDVGYWRRGDLVWIQAQRPIRRLKLSFRRGGQPIRLFAPATHALDYRSDDRRSGAR
ncbi:MAG: hypothetical protein H6707_06665 [Deltaproteobacteria bacterium]|nr:hypothetical protein [Deltaproteobacteria bacterium]